MKFKNILAILFVPILLVLISSCQKASQGTPVKTYKVILGNVGNTAYGNLLNISSGNVSFCSGVTDSATSSRIDIVQNFYMTSSVLDFDAPSYTNTGCATTFMVKQPTGLMAITLDTNSFNAIQYDSQLQNVINANSGATVGGLTIVTPPYAMLVKTFGGAYAVVMCTGISGNGSSASSYAQYTVKVIQ